MQLSPALHDMSHDPGFLIAPGAERCAENHAEAFTSVSSAEARGSVSRVFFPHEVVVRDVHRALNFRHCHVLLGSVTLNQIGYGADVDVLIDDLRRSHYVFVLSLSGWATVGFEGRNRRLEPGDCVLMTPDTGYAFEMSVDHTHLAIGVPTRLLTGAGSPYRGVHNIAHGAEAFPGGGASNLVPFLDYLCGEFHRGSPLLGLPQVAEAHEASLIALMRASLFGEDAIFRGALPGFVHRAERFISQHLDEDIGLEDISAAAQVPLRTLYHGFDRFLGQSPMRWLRLRRLEQARADILASDGDLSVTDLAHRYWMGHSGRFAGLYRDIYAEPPSTTLARVRDLRRRQL